MKMKGETKSKYVLLDLTDPAAQACPTCRVMDWARGEDPAEFLCPVAKVVVERKSPRIGCLEWSKQ